MTLRYDLIDEPWILAQRHDGTVETISLTRLFEHAGEYARLAGDLPTQALPILRLALAVVHAATGGPADGEEWRRLWKAKRLPTGPIADYLADHRDRFDLFHPQTPFYQVADLATKKTESGLAAFIADVPTGNPKYATRTAEGLDRIGFDEAARWLVHCQAFDLSGIKGAAEGDPRAKGGKSYPIGPGSLGRLGAVHPEGEDLAETLLLNLIPVDYLEERGAVLSEDDAPVWERDPHGPAPEARAPEGAPKGMLDLYTWQTRRLRLLADEDGVTGAIICQGDRLELRDQFKTEPMTAWRRSENQERQLKSARVYLPRRHDPARSAWRGLAASLPALSGGDGPASLPPLALEWIGAAHSRGWLERDRRINYHVTGIAYGTQEAVITEVIDDRLTMAAAVFDAGNRELAATVADAAADAETAVKALSGLARDLVKAAGGRDSVAGAGDEAAVTGYAALDVHYRDWLHKLEPDDDTDMARAAWQRRVWTVVRGFADALVAAAGPAAWKGHMDGDRLISSAVAQNVFNRKINKALPQAFPSRPDAKETP